MNKEIKRELEHAVRYHQRGLENATCAVSAGYHQDKLNAAILNLRELTE